MELYLVRHAIAVDALPGQSDEARPLSKEGVEKFKRGVQGLHKLEIELDRIYYSPRRRAVQTAELLMPVLKGEAQVMHWLAQPPTPALLAGLSGEAVALVGHEPWMGELCAWLIGGNLRGEPFPFKKGGVAHLRGLPKPGHMHMVAFLPPSVLRAL